MKVLNESSVRPVEKPQFVMKGQAIGRSEAMNEKKKASEIIMRSTLIFLVAGFVCVYDVAHATEWQLVCQEDFSSEPGWTTNDPSNFFWNEQEGYYQCTLVYPSGDEEATYSVVGITPPTSSFKITYDIMVITFAGNMSVGFGLFEEGHLNSVDARGIGPRSVACWYEVAGVENPPPWVDPTQKMFRGLYSSGPEGLGGAGGYANPVLDTWLTVSILYDHSTGVIVATHPFGGGSASTGFPGGYPSPDMCYLGVSNNVWNGEAAGTISVRLDNVRLYVLEVGIEASAHIEPNTLNLKNKGRWITCYIELPEGYDVGEIDVNTIILNEEVPAELQPNEIGDYDDDGVPDLMVKFDMSAVQEILEVGNEIEITVTGELTDGTPFEGIDKIRVIEKGGKK